MAGFASNLSTFRAMPSPYLPVAGRTLQQDRYLYRVLGQEWLRRYVGGKEDDLFSRQLFRSLETAFTAASVGAKNLASLHDYGVQMGLWVSAIEILTWGVFQGANRDRSLDLLQRYQWRDERLDKATAVPTLKLKRQVNLVQHACVLMYYVRNDFLHGNPVSYDSLRLAPDREVYLPSIAAIVYRTVLVAYLQAIYPPAAITLDAAESDARWVGDLFDDMEYSSGLRWAFGIDRDEDDEPEGAR